MRILACVLLLAAPLVAQHGLYERESKHPAIGDPKAIAAGEALYMRSCAGCHGPDGSGGRGPNLVRRPMWHPLTDEKIFSLIRNGLPGADMPATNLSDDETWNLVAFIHALIGPAADNPAAGDAAAGEKVFWSEKTGCSNCHAIHGKGGRLGPDLTNIGGLRPLALIKESVLEPSEGLYFLGNEAVTVKLKNGETIRGVARNRDNYSLQVVDRQGKLHLISTRDVAEIEIREGSPMPGDYGKRLSEDELENLFAFLARQSLRKGEEESK
jgi:putative heme-binding domain-containing protein